MLCKPPQFLTLWGQNGPKLRSARFDFAGLGVEFIAKGSNLFTNLVNIIRERLAQPFASVAELSS